MMFDVALDDESCKAFILVWINSVLYDTKNVETRQNRFCKVDILRKCKRRVVSPSNWIGCSNNGTAAKE